MWFSKGMESRAFLQAFLVICLVVLAAEGEKHDTVVSDIYDQFERCDIRVVKARFPYGWWVWMCLTWKPRQESLLWKSVSRSYESITQHHVDKKKPHLHLFTFNPTVYLHFVVLLSETVNPHSGSFNREEQNGLYTGEQLRESSAKKKNKQTNSVGFGQGMRQWTSLSTIANSYSYA